MANNVLTDDILKAAIIASVSLLICTLSQSTSSQEQARNTGPSYHELWREVRPGVGIRYQDPNVYVYTSEFAQRFQMPEEWISTELKGADAVAFRSRPSYPTCGWGGNPKACNFNEVRCEMDLYFDHKNNPLPWDPRYPEVLENTYTYSPRFIPSEPRIFRLPIHPNLRATKYSPFLLPGTGKGLDWQYFTSLENRSGWGWMLLLSYDREQFLGVARLTFHSDCGTPLAALALASDYLSTPLNPSAPDLYKTVFFPTSWQSRVQLAMREVNDRRNAFFKSVGEKVIKALREAPVPQRFVVPLQ
jgi:hypothetical protein